MSGLAEQRWRALRALHENHGAPDGLLAAASRLKEASIAAAAKRQGWVRMNRPAVTQLINQLLERLVRDAHAIGEAGADNYPKGQIDAIGALLRTAEKLRDMTAGDDEPQQETKERDDKIAAILGRIDTQIHNLAHAYAGDIAKGCGQKPRRQGGEKAGGEEKQQAGRRRSAEAARPGRKAAAGNLGKAGD